MAEKICTGCGYEGSGKKAQQSGGGMFRLLGILTMLPFFSLWKLMTGRATNECPHCHLPALVKKNSEEGRQAQRRFDIELGLATPTKPRASQSVGDPRASFGNDQPTAAAPTRKRTVDPEQW